ncbi:hypothetical protein ATL17_1628 [Maritalea mobilis]|uniref:Uncharacterized protein n=1 Tax=Maritalea mobilis TaxID=483324 RepID=A0A4R6VTW4_9HYPH|nr:hypothetical protein [Maritalea mobilis]TDQ63621.1 hypothetical protein ATL17_1628 [Maritalea mobilis]
MPRKIKDRIVDALTQHGNGGFLVYHELAKLVFPKDKYPNAWNHPARGGPPGCYMVLSRAIREHGFYISYEDAPAVVYATVGLAGNLPTKDQ